MLTAFVAHQLQCLPRGACGQCCLIPGCHKISQSMLTFLVCCSSEALTAQGLDLAQYSQPAPQPDTDAEGSARASHSGMLRAASARPGPGLADGQARSALAERTRSMPPPDGLAWDFHSGRSSPLRKHAFAWAVLAGSLGQLSDRLLVSMYCQGLAEHASTRRLQPGVLLSCVFDSLQSMPPCCQSELTPWVFEQATSP